MHRHGLGIGVARSHRPLPPLAETRHRRVVQGHVRADPHDLPTITTQAHTKLWFLTSDQRGVESSRLLKHMGTHHVNAAALIDDPRCGIPLHVAEPVIDRQVTMALAHTAGDDGGLLEFIQRAGPALQPPGAHFAVAVDELHITHTRMHLHEPGESLIPGPGRGERHRHIQLDHMRAQTTGPINAAVRRTRIHVDDRHTVPVNRQQTDVEPLPFIAANHDEPDVLCIHSRIPISRGGLSHDAVDGSPDGDCMATSRGTCRRQPAAGARIMLSERSVVKKPRRACQPVCE